VRGIGAVGGMAMARIYLMDEDTPEIIKTYVKDTEEEYQRLLKAKKVSALQLESIMKAAAENLGQENSEIFDYQLLMLEDKDFFGEIREHIVNEHVNCEYALNIVAGQYIDLFANIDNDYLRERTTDVADLAKRLNFALSGKEMKTLSGISEDSIIAAVDLTPSQTAGINKDRVKGIILERGGKSSHSVIIARSMGIPCIVGVTEIMKNAVHGDITMINGDTGEVIVSPTSDQIIEFQVYENNTLKEKQLLNKYIQCKSKTQDGFEVKVLANITSENETDSLIENGGEGVGLFRTEFMYMSNSMPPSEDLQYKTYSNIAKALNGRTLIIRTLDAGGDKNIPYLKIPKEENPFLGYRAIRYCLDNPEIFKTQISAILRAGVYSNIEFMIPMIASIVELRQTKAIIEEVKQELIKKGIQFGNNVRLGMMMETPAAAFMADRFAKEVDFFSIGTNDLTQYLFAADRMNQNVAYLNSYFHPALLHTVKHICDSAKKQGINVDICGQAGEIPILIPLWVAMGVDNLSVSIPSIPKVRKIICDTNKSNAIKILERTLALDTEEEVKSYLNGQFCL
jgi:phosphoenolpyruvate-protein phosphotransferase (PTS system enzyme I)